MFISIIKILASKTTLTSLCFIILSGITFQCQDTKEISQSIFDLSCSGANSAVVREHVSGAVPRNSASSAEIMGKALEILFHCKTYQHSHSGVQCFSSQNGASSQYTRTTNAITSATIPQLSYTRIFLPIFHQNSEPPSEAAILQ